jgi:hypothetical protein
MKPRSVGERERKPMKQIHILRNDPDHVTFETVNIDTTENVFFTNMDPDQPHKPSILNLQDDEQLGPFPSPNSSQVPVPLPAAKNPNPPPLYIVPYTCDIPDTTETKHSNEKGFINVYAPLAAVAKTALTAIKGKATRQQLVSGGMPFYKITGLIVNNKNIPDPTGVTSPIGNDFGLVQDTQGIWVQGTGAQVETYNFTFTVDDAMNRNLQQVQYSLTVTAS